MSLHYDRYWGENKLLRYPVSRMSSNDKIAKITLKENQVVKKAQLMSLQLMMCYVFKRTLPNKCTVHMKVAF